VSLGFQRNVFEKLSVDLNITFRIFCIIDAIEQLSVYDPQIVGIAEALNPLKNLNAITLADFKKELAASKEQIEASRAAFLK
jgi:hypothetical protein